MEAVQERFREPWQEPWTVKPLKWAEWAVKHNFGRGVCEASTPFNYYYEIQDCVEAEFVKTGEWQRFYCPNLSRSFDTLDEAKAAAQADFEQRIRGAILSATKE